MKTDYAPFEEDFALSPWEEEHADCGASLGDPRRCPVHPQCATSSPDGMFDAPCDLCEAEMDADADCEHGAEEPDNLRAAGPEVELNDDDFPF